MSFKAIDKSKEIKRSKTKAKLVQEEEIHSGSNPRKVVKK